MQSIGVGRTVAIAKLLDNKSNVENEIQKNWRIAYPKCSKISRDK